MYNHVRRLAKERDHYLSRWANLVVNEVAANEDGSTRLPEKKTANRSNQNNAVYNSTTTTAGFENNHLAVELADWKARLRKQRQEL